MTLIGPGADIHATHMGGTCRLNAPGWAVTEASVDSRPVPASGSPIGGGMPLPFDTDTALRTILDRQPGLALEVGSDLRGEEYAMPMLVAVEEFGRKGIAPAMAGATLTVQNDPHGQLA